jgi:hypothetical protein
MHIIRRKRPGVAYNERNEKFLTDQLSWTLTPTPVSTFLKIAVHTMAHSEPLLDHDRDAVDSARCE